MLKTHGQLEFYGVLLHTTGDGPPKEAYRFSKSALRTAVDIYSNMKEGPHYVVAPDGFEQIRDTGGIAWHAGVSAEHRRDYLSGHWEQLVGADLVKWWRSRWGNLKSPQHLYPAASPNTNYVGIELVPCGTYIKNEWVPVLGEPAYPKCRFTMPQLIQCARIVAGVFENRDMDAKNLKRSQLLGHEDVNPITRPGWDPGHKLGAFSWEIMNNLVKEI